MKKLSPLQYANCPNTLPLGKPLIQLPAIRESSEPFFVDNRVTELPLIPTCITTILLSGKGTETGAIAGLVFISITSG